jgi:hypothetical protein
MSSQQQELRVRTVVKCTRCDYTNTRDFKDGDYVLKTEEGQCPKDGGELYIAGIYAEEVKREQQRK